MPEWKHRHVIITSIDISSQWLIQCSFFSYIEHCVCVCTIKNMKAHSSRLNVHRESMDIVGPSKEWTAAHSAVKCKRTLQLIHSYICVRVRAVPFIILTQSRENESAGESWSQMRFAIDWIKLLCVCTVSFRERKKYKTFSLSDLIHELVLGMADVCTMVAFVSSLTFSDSTTGTPTIPHESDTELDIFEAKQTEQQKTKTFILFMHKNFVVDFIIWKLKTYAKSNFRSHFEARVCFQTFFFCSPLFAPQSNEICVNSLKATTTIQLLDILRRSDVEKHEKYSKFATRESPVEADRCRVGLCVQGKYSYIFCFISIQFFFAKRRKKNTHNIATLSFCKLYLHSVFQCRREYFMVQWMAWFRLSFDIKTFSTFHFNR